MAIWPGTGRCARLPAGWSAVCGPATWWCAFGGDEFTALIDDLCAASDAVLAARRIIDCLAAPLVIDGCSINVTTSVGVATNFENCRRIDDLLRNADRAMYRAKSLGGSEVILFEDDPLWPRRRQ